MLRRPQSSTRTDTLFPYTTLFRSGEPPEFAVSRLVAFGMTRRPGRSADNDPSLAALLNSRADAVCMVGKSWDFHVDVALEVPRRENVAMIAESVAHAATRKSEVLRSEDRRVGNECVRTCRLCRWPYQ